MRLQRSSVWSLKAARRRQPSRRLAGDRSDAVIVLVVVQNGDSCRFGSRGDQQVRMLHGALKRAALGAELLVDPQRALPVGLVDRAVGQRGELLPYLFELARATRTVKQFETHHV